MGRPRVGAASCSPVFLCAAVPRADRNASDEAADAAAYLMVTFGGPYGNDHVGLSCKKVDLEEGVSIIIFAEDLVRWRVQRWTIGVGNNIVPSMPIDTTLVPITLRTVSKGLHILKRLVSGYPKNAIRMCEEISLPSTLPKGAVKAVSNVSSKHETPMRSVFRRPIMTGKEHGI